MTSNEVISRCVEIAVQASYELWKDQKFRELISFAEISQTEQDRIFNELEVTALGLLILYTDTKSQISNSEHRITEEFLKMLSGLDIPKHLIKMWKKLIGMRLKEYREDYQLAVEQMEKWPEVQNDPVLRFVWPRVETQTIDGLSHIRRGDVKKEDQLWKYLRAWLTTLDVIFSEQFNKVTETPFDKDKLN